MISASNQMISCTSPKEPFTLVSLPQEMLVEVLSYLSPQELAITSLVCRKLTELSTEWTLLFAKEIECFLDRKITLLCSESLPDLVLKIVKCVVKIFPEMKKNNFIQFPVFTRFLQDMGIRDNLSPHLNVREQPIELAKIFIKCGAFSDVRNLNYAIKECNDELVELLLDGRDPDVMGSNKIIVTEYTTSKTDTLRTTRYYDICCFALKNSSEKIFLLVVNKLLGSLDKFEQLAANDRKNLNSAIKNQNVENVLKVLESPYFSARNSIKNRFEFCDLACGRRNSQISLAVIERFYDSFDEYLQHIENQTIVMESQIQNLYRLILAHPFLIPKWFLNSFSRDLLKAFCYENIEQINAIMEARDKELQKKERKANYELWRDLQRKMDYEICCLTLLEEQPKSFLMALETLNISIPDLKKRIRRLNRIFPSERNKTLLSLLHLDLDKGDLEKQLRRNIKIKKLEEQETEIDEESEEMEVDGLDNTLDSDAECSYNDDSDLSECDGSDLSDIENFSVKRRRFN